MSYAVSAVVVRRERPVDALGRVRGGRPPVERDWRALAERLREDGARVTTHFCPGTHSPAYWERELRHALPMLLKPLVG